MDPKAKNRRFLAGLPFFLCLALLAKRREDAAGNATVPETYLGPFGIKARRLDAQTVELTVLYRGEALHAYTYPDPE